MTATLRSGGESLNEKEVMRERAELVSEIQRTEFLGNHLSSCLKLSFIMLLALVRNLSIFSFSQEDFSFFLTGKLEGF